MRSTPCNHVVVSVVRDRFVLQRNGGRSRYLCGSGGVYPVTTADWTDEASRSTVCSLVGYGVRSNQREFLLIVALCARCSGDAHRTRRCLQLYVLFYDTSPVSHSRPELDPLPCSEKRKKRVLTHVVVEVVAIVCRDESVSACHEVDTQVSRPLDAYLLKADHRSFRYL